MDVFMPLWIFVSIVTLPYWRRWSVTLWEWLSWAVPILWRQWCGEPVPLKKSPQPKRALADKERPKRVSYLYIACLERELGLTERGATCESCGRVSLMDEQTPCLFCGQCNSNGRISLAGDRLPRAGDVFVDRHGPYAPTHERPADGHVASI